jgi:hypothetical protein
MKKYYSKISVKQDNSTREIQILAVQQTFCQIGD